VVAAIAILGTILVGVVMAKSGHTHQIALTARENLAVRATDDLISQWWSGAGGIPIGESGTLGPDESMTWKTSLVDNGPIAGLGARVVRVEIHDVRAKTLQPSAADTPLLAVDLVVPDPEREPKKPAAPGKDGKRPVAPTRTTARSSTGTVAPSITGTSAGSAAGVPSGIPAGALPAVPATSPGGVGGPLSATPRGGRL
jgi:hypothetical protein